MKSPARILLLLLPLIALSGLQISLAPDAVAQEKPAVSDATTAEGTISTVNKEKSELSIRTALGREMFFTLDKNASIFQGEKEGNWGALKTGATASVKFQTRGDKRIASQVRVADETTTAAKDSKDSKEEKDAKENESPVAVNVKGTIVEMKPDFSLLTLRPFGAKEDLTLLVGDDLRFRLRNNKTDAKDFSKGAEVRAIYVVKEGKNFLTSLGDVKTDTTTKTESGTTDQPRDTSYAAGKDLVSGKIIRIRKDLVIICTNQGDHIVLMTPDSREPVLIDAGTKIQVDGKLGRIADLREGADAQVSYDQSGGRVRARSIVATTNTTGTQGASPGQAGAAPAQGNVAPGGVAGTGVNGGSVYPGGGVWPGFLPGYYPQGGGGSLLPSVPGGNVQGKVTRTIGTVLFLRSADGREFALPTDASTRFVFNGKPGTLANFTPGIDVVVMTQNDGSKISLLIYGTTSVGGTPGIPPGPPGTQPGTPPPGTPPGQPPGTPPGTPPGEPKGPPPGTPTSPGPFPRPPDRPPESKKPA